MDDLTLRYYDAEMRYLLEAGEEFARAHPEQAAMLNLDKAGARDPFVERLFEGFAFLMGRMREKLDDDLPELTGRRGQSAVATLFTYHSLDVGRGIHPRLAGNERADDDGQRL